MKAKEDSKMPVSTTDMTSEAAAAKRALIDSRRAALNLLEDAEEARCQAERINEKLRLEIAERKRAEGELRTALRRLYSILSGMYGAILLVSNTGNVEFANEPFCRYFQLKQSPSDLVGLDPQGMLGLIADRFEHPEQAIRRIQEIVERGEAIRSEEVRMSDGRTCLRDFIPIDLGEGHYGRVWHHIDITERKHAEKELRYHANLTENISDGIISTDKELNIRSWNSAAERIYGWKADEVIGLKGSGFLETAFPEGASRESIAKGIFEKGGWEGELIQRTKDGRNIIVQARSMALKDEAGNVIGGVSISRDITERKKAEQKMVWLASFPEQNPNPIVEIDLPADEVKYANSIAERLFPDLIRLGPAHPFLAGAREGVSAAPSKGEQLVREVAIGEAWYLETMSLTPDRQRLRVYGLDITKRKRTEEALSESVGRERERAREWAALLDAVPTPVFVTHDPDGRRITGNRAADELLCNPRGGEASLGAPENARPHHFRAFKDGREMSVDELPAQRAARGERVAGLEFSLVFDDGTIRDVIGYGMPLLDAEGRPRGSILTLTDITERNRAAEALRESEKRLVRAQEMASLGSWELDVAQNRVNWSDEVYRLFGFQPEAFDATYEAFFEAVHPEDRAALDASFMDSVREGRDSFESEYRIIRRDNGETRFVHTKSENMRDENGRIVRSSGMIHDITEQKKTEALRQALAEQERIRLGAAVEQASDSVVMFDLDGTIRYVNAAFESINRIPRDRAIGRSYFDLFGDLAEASSIQQAFAQGKAWHGPLTYQTPDGRALDLEMTVSPIRNPDGTIIGGLATATDVTRQSALQQQIRQAQKMEALGTLAGGITHDFNNILGTIIINTELALLDMDLSDPGRKSLPIVLQAANRGKELVKQIITFSRQRAWERKPLEIAATVKEGLGLLRSTLPKDISVHEKIDPRSGIVLADPSHIHQILVNLCQNAALAMMDCGGDLKVGLGPIEVDAFMAVRNPDLKPGPYVRLTVSDTGCGMGSDILDRIFEPFFTTRQQGKGSGLGLAVVHGIVKSYDGAIAVQSQPGQGSVFSTYLHRLEGAAATPGVEPPVHAVGGRERILLVEDEETQRTSLARGLEHLGYKITAAADGRSALAEFRKDPNSFDLVITDQTMPKMSGLELASEMAKIRPDISIILCTGFSEKVDDGTVGRYGIRELVMKPFTITEITQAIGKAVKKNGVAI